MPVSVLMPHQKPEPREKQEVDPMDKILKGLNIAASIYGLKEAYDKGQMLKEDRELNKLKLSEAAKAKEMEELTITPKDWLNFGDKYQTVDANTPGARKFYQKDFGGKASEIFLIPKEKQIVAQKTGPVGGPKKETTERLAPEQQAVATSLSQKNASKIAIKNQIDAVMGNWDNLSDKQKIVQGRQLLKTLNSQEGADAIGAEEAKRLGGLLEFQFFNISEPGPLFGRDLEEFKTQAKETSTAIGRAVDTNRSIVEGITGRKQLYQGLDQTPQEKTAQITREQAAQELIRRQGLRSAVGRK